MDKQLNTKGIDGLRGIGAVCIALFSHYYFWIDESMYPFYNGITYWFWHYASFFVEMFFVISGFVMVYAYKDKIKQGKENFSLFVKKRLVRFYPLMVFSLIAVTLFQVLHLKLCGEFFAPKMITDYSMLTFVMNLLCLQGTSLVPSSFNAPSWYLSIVFIMYIIFFVVTYWAGKYNKERLAYVGMALLGLVLAIKAYPTIFLNCRGVLGFFVGCILCEICYWYKNIDKKKRDIINIILLLTLILICYLGIKYTHNFYTKNVLLVVIYGGIIWPLLVFLVINMPILTKIMSIKPCQFLSKISFSLYLMHFPVMVALDGINKYFNLGVAFYSKRGFVLYVAVVFVVAIICHYLVEEKVTGYFKGLINEKKL